jgi:hypothetical protein
MFEALAIGSFLVRKPFRAVHCDATLLFLACCSLLSERAGSCFNSFRRARHVTPKPDPVFQGEYRRDVSHPAAATETIETGLVNTEIRVKQAAPREAI